MIEGGDVVKDFTDFLRGEDNGQFESGIGADQFDLGGPALAEGFFPEDFNGADGLGGRLAGELLFGFEVKEVLAEFFGADQFGRLGVVLAKFAEARPVTQDGAFGHGKQPKVVEEAVQDCVGSLFFLSIGRRIYC